MCIAKIKKTHSRPYNYVYIITLGLLARNQVKLAIETKQTGYNIYSLHFSKNISVINFSRQKSTSKLGLAIMSLAF